MHPRHEQRAQEEAERTLERASHMVVAGYDGSCHSAGVLSTAARAATDRDEPLTILALAQAWLGHADTLADVVAAEGAAMRQAGDEVDRAASALRQAWVDLAVRGRVIMGADEVRDSALARESSLLVLGRAGPWGRPVLTPAAPSVALARALRCPVLLPARPGASPAGAGGVVVGLKANAVEAALHLAAAEARRRHVPLTLVHAVPSRTEPARAGVRRTGQEGIPERGGAPERQVWDWVTQRVHDHGGLEGLMCQVHLVVGDPAEALVEHVGSGSLLVIGAHRADSLVSAALGSVGRAVIERAACEVLITR